jgi:TatD DNase family protein
MNDLVDIGLNLGHDSFDQDREAVLARAARAGVSRCIVTGASVTGSAQALELAQARPGQLFATAGVHPHHADTLDQHGVNVLRRLLAHTEVVAVGECGLDFFRDFSPRDAQERAFVAQLDLAVDVQLPVFLHQREAHARFLELLEPRRDALAGGVAHCFTGGRSELDDYLALGLYIGITGWLCDEQRGQALREAVVNIPHDRLLIETDAPYLLPKDLAKKPRGRRNEPAFLPHILNRIAELRGEPASDLARATRENAERLFKLVPRA